MINDKLKQVADLMQECVKAGKFELKNQDDGTWHVWIVDGLPCIKMFEDGLIRPYDPLREFKEAFARGETVEISGALGWIKLQGNPQWACSPDHYRIAPKRWYRVAETLAATSTADNEHEEKTIQSFPDFVRWLTERVYY